MLQTETSKVAADKLWRCEAVYLCCTFSVKLAKHTEYYELYIFCEVSECWDGGILFQTILWLNFNRHNQPEEGEQNLKISFCRMDVLVAVGRNVFSMIISDQTKNFINISPRLTNPRNARYLLEISEGIRKIGIGYCYSFLTKPSENISY